MQTKSFRFIGACSVNILVCWRRVGHRWRRAGRRVGCRLGWDEWRKTAATQEQEEQGAGCKAAAAARCRIARERCRTGATAILWMRQTWFIRGRPRWAGLWVGGRAWARVWATAPTATTTTIADGDAGNRRTGRFPTGIRPQRRRAVCILIRHQAIRHPRIAGIGITAREAPPPRAVPACP